MSSQSNMVPWLVSVSSIPLKISVQLGLLDISENKGLLMNLGISKDTEAPGWWLRFFLSALKMMTLGHLTFATTPQVGKTDRSKIPY